MAKAHRTIPPLSEQDIGRFWSKVTVTGDDDCWEWNGYKRLRGYGAFQLNGSPHITSRIAYKLHYNVDPMELLVCHSCDNPPCCNPRHLFLGTAADNSRDMVTKQRQNTPNGERHGSKTKPGSRARGERSNLAKLTAEEALEIRRLYSSGLTQKQIATSFGITREGVASIIQANTWKHIAAESLSDRNRLANPGERNGSAKLTATQVREIRQLASEKPRRSYQAIGRQYGITGRMASLIANRKAWTHL